MISSAAAMVRLLVCACALLCFGGLGAAAVAQTFPRDVPGTVTGRATLSAHADTLYGYATVGPVPGQPDERRRGDRGDALKPFPGTALRGLRTTLGLANCADVERRLQTAAIADAHARADRLASASGVSIGPPTIISPGGLRGYAFPCDLDRMPQGFGAGGDLPEDGNVEFGLFVNVTYSIVRR